MMTTVFAQLFLRARSFVGTLSLIIPQIPCSVPLCPPQEEVFTHLRDEETKAQS